MDLVLKLPKKKSYFKISSFYNCNLFPYSRVIPARSIYMDVKDASPARARESCVPARTHTHTRVYYVFFFVPLIVQVTQCIRRERLDKQLF